MHSKRPLTGYPTPKSPHVSDLLSKMSEKRTYCPVFTLKIDPEHPDMTQIHTDRALKNPEHLRRY
jgi:hypothetical protein